MKKGVGDDPFADGSEEKETNERARTNDRGGATDGEVSTEGTDVAEESDARTEERRDRTVEDETDSTTDGKAAAAVTDVSTSRTESENVDEAGGDESTTEDDEADTSDSERSANDASSAAASVQELPYLARRQLRNGSVKADRDQVPFFLRTEIKGSERDFRRAVEDELGQEINKTDLREAAYVFAQEHPEGVAEVLRKWGIKYLE